MMPQIPYSNEKLEVIDFDSSNASFKGNYPFSYSYALAMSPEGDLVFVVQAVEFMLLVFLILKILLFFQKYEHDLSLINALTIL